MVWLLGTFEYSFYVSLTVFYTETMSFRYKIPGIVFLLLFLLLGLALSQSHPVDSEHHQNPKRRTSDPVANFFSGLGDLILDVDETIAVQSQPHLEREANVLSQLFRPRPRNEYLDRIQKNYREMQKRLGKLIGNTIGFKDSYSDHELSTINPPPETFSPTITPDYNPFAEAAEARKGKLKERISKGSNNLKNPVELLPRDSIPRAIPETLKAFGSISKALIEDIGDISRKSGTSKSHSKENDFPKGRMGSLDLEECSNEVLEDPELEQRRQKKCSRIAVEERSRADLRKLMLEPIRASESLFSASSRMLDQLSKDILDRNGDTSTESLVTTDNSESETKVHAEASIDECSDKVLEDPHLENVRKEKCARKAAEDRLMKDINKLLADSRRASEKLIPVGSKAIEDLSSIFIRRNGDAEDRTLGDMLYSDSSFDKQIRQLIKDHGSWILDYPLIKRWRQRGRTSEDDFEVTTIQSSEELESTTAGSTSDDSEIETTEVYVPVSMDYDMALQKSGEVPEHPYESSYYRIVNEDGDVMEDEVNIVLDPESFSHDAEMSEIEKQEPKETVILAFTSDGVPLKLRLGPEIDNPLRYLHKILNSAGVSLNIPVESYDDLEPVGKEVLKLGSGILNRAVLINASNANELKSLIKALMASKSSGKTSI